MIIDVSYAAISTAWHLRSLPHVFIEQVNYQPNVTRFYAWGSMPDEQYRHDNKTVAIFKVKRKPKS